MAEASARSEKITDIMTGRIGQGLKQFLGTTGLALIATWSPFLAFAGVPALMLVDYFVQKRREHNLYRSIRMMYADEISALAGISSSEITTAKTQEIISSHINDPRFLPFQEMIALYNKGTKKNLITSAVSAVITSSVVCVASLLHMPVAQISFYTGTFTALLFDAMREIFNSDMQEAGSKSISVVVRELAQQAALQQVQPAKVMQVFLKAQPRIQEQVKQRFGKPYEEMSLGEKNQVVAIYDNALHVTEITAKINAGAIRPTEMAWIAFGQRSGVPEKPYISKATQTNTDKLQMRSDFVERLQQQQMHSATAISPTIH